MNWLGPALRENPYILGAFFCVGTFVFLRLVQFKPFSTVNALMICVVLWGAAAFKVMRFWPPTLVQWETLVGTTLVCFLVGLMLSRLGSITFITSTREFVFDLSVLGSALTALCAGIVVTLLALYEDKFGGSAAHVAGAAWITGAMLDQWRRVARAGGA